jgi:predicted GIY-YIG superfamily endonuclease
MLGVVYLLTNLVNGKYYVGQTRNVGSRRWTHAHGKSSMLIGNAIRKHGWAKVKEMKVQT